MPAWTRPRAIPARIRPLGTAESVFWAASAHSMEITIRRSLEIRQSVDCHDLPTSIQEDARLLLPFYPAISAAFFSSLGRLRLCWLAERIW
jgi:hypothetical protein